MKILILNTSELTGGAAVAANRLAKALGKSGVEVSMLVRDRKTDHVKAFSVNNSWTSHRLSSFHSQYRHGFIEAPISATGGCDSSALGESRIFVSF